MPRPTSAQLAYGSATVVCSTVVALLLSGARTGLQVGVIAVAGLALGLLVAVRLPVRRGSRTVTSRPARFAATTPGEVPPVHTQAQADTLEPRVSEHSLPG